VTLGVLFALAPARRRRGAAAPRGRLQPAGAQDRPHPGRAHGRGHLHGLRDGLRLVCALRHDPARRGLRASRDYLPRHAPRRDPARTGARRARARGGARLPAPRGERGAAALARRPLSRLRGGLGLCGRAPAVLALARGGGLGRGGRLDPRPDGRGHGRRRAHHGPRAAAVRSRRRAPRGRALPPHAGRGFPSRPARQRRLPGLCGRRGAGLDPAGRRHGAAALRRGGGGSPAGARLPLPGLRGGRAARGPRDGRDAGALAGLRARPARSAHPPARSHHDAAAPGGARHLPRLRGHHALGVAGASLLRLARWRRCRCPPPASSQAPRRSARSSRSSSLTCG
jgi:hypothetical protein